MSVAEVDGARFDDARVDVRGLTWRPFGRPAPVLRDVDLRLEPGEHVLLAGPSGAGKSTLLSALAGQLCAEDGELTGSVDVRGRVGLLLQDPGTAVVAERAGRDTAFGPENLGLTRKEIWARVDVALREADFPYDRHRPTSALSGGEGQRLALAGALALRPGLLLLDEPTAMLDAPTAARVRAAIVAVARASGATLVVVEHQMAPWWPHVDRVVTLSADGRVVADAAPPPSPSPDRARLDTPQAHLVAKVRGGGGRVLVSAREVVGAPPGWRRGQPATRVGPFDADVVAGAVTTLQGPSGSGKSTLLALLAGLSVPIAGDVMADAGWAPRGRRCPHTWRSRELAQRVAWLPQLPEHALVATTVRDEVLATSRALGHTAVDAGRRADQLMDALGLHPLAEQNPHTLSGGEQRRLGLAGALAHAPQVLLLDEPTVGQDALTWRAVVDTVLAAVGGGTAAVIASHDADLIDAVGAR